MSAPQTNVEKQTKRHRPSLLGIAVAVAIAMVLLVVFLFWVADDGGAPEGAEVQVEPGVGTETTEE